MSDKKPIISVTANDCEWSFTRGTGKGGQKRNKTSNAVHCWHKPSGAHSFSQDGRSQLHNRQDAFRKMVESALFQKWLKIETAKRLGIESSALAEVERQMRHIKIEGKDERGRWIELPEEVDDGI